MTDGEWNTLRISFKQEWDESVFAFSDTKAFDVLFFRWLVIASHNSYDAWHTVTESGWSALFARQLLGEGVRIWNEIVIYMYTWT